MKLFYQELAPYWALVSPVEDYAEEAVEVLRVLEEYVPKARTLLELGSGGGHMAFHLKRRFAMTLTDLSVEMLEVSTELNPECEHIAGDMRTIDIGRTFDVVFVHDAIDYMTTESDLEATMTTAYRHLKPGGLFVLLPDAVRERYLPSTDCGGSDDDQGRGIRYLEWSAPVGPNDTAGITHYAFLVKSADGTVRSVTEAHQFGLFSEDTWKRLLAQVGFAASVVEEKTSEDRQPRLIFLGRKEAGHS